MFQDRKRKALVKSRSAEVLTKRTPQSVLMKENLIVILPRWPLQGVLDNQSLFFEKKPKPSALH